MKKQYIFQTAHRLTRNIVKGGKGYRTIFAKMLKHVHMMVKLQKSKVEGGIRVIKTINSKNWTKSTIELVCSPKQAFNYINDRYVRLSNINTTDTYITYSIQEQW